MRCARVNACLRARDGTGFATDLDRFEVLWRAHACPAITSVGEALPEVYQASQTPPKCPVPVDLRFDLRQGAFSPSPNILRQAAGIACALAVVGSLGQGALVLRDVKRLEAQALTSRARLEAGLQSVAPGLPLTASGIAALDRLIAQHSRPKTDPFLSLVANVSSGLLASGDQVTLLALDYDAASVTGGLELQASGLEALRIASARLEAQGLRVSSGAVTAGDGLARTRFTVSEVQHGD